MLVLGINFPPNAIFLNIILNEEDLQHHTENGSDVGAKGEDDYMEDEEEGVKDHGVAKEVTGLPIHLLDEDFIAQLVRPSSYHHITVLSTDAPRVHGRSES